MLPAIAVYPILFYLLIDRMGLAATATGLGMLVAARLLILERLAPSWRLFCAVGLGAYLTLVLVVDDAKLFKLYPVAINGALLCYGLYTLYRPPSAIERLMRLLNVPVSEAGVKYTRGVTILWCGYFALNACAAAYTALASPLYVWAAYNGAISYAIAAALFAGEWLFRGWYKRQAANRPQDAHLP